ncbi:MAG TPA: RsmB/NOP family class I SAM-dependent RNA methyltransferase [Bacteroidota bacterium]|nr:RsmB/NOP family class I SAM-dependent RNA methyltransferase [Bacteroidota bacterium]
MNRSSLIGHVIEALTLVGSARRPADTVIGEFFRERRYLGSTDRRFIAETVYGVLRNYRLLAARAARALGIPGDSPVDPVALVAALESATPDADPELVASGLGERWAGRQMSCAEFVRSVRQCAGEESTWPLAVRHSIPDFVAAEWMRKFSPDEAEALCAASNDRPPVTIRANTLKGEAGACAAALLSEGIESSAGGLSPVALLLPRRINAASLRSFRDGLFEIQDEGSQLVAPLLEAHPGMAVLDACAGSGGKSLHLAALMENRGEITALDIDRGRLEKLSVRARRAGATIIRSALVRPGPAPLRPDTYDAVLIDAPCSGTGTFRRSPWTKLTCTEEYSHLLASRQRELLRRYAPCVKRGGRLVYATCTLLAEENARVVEDFLALRPDFTLLSAADLLSRQGIHLRLGSPYLELFPHVTGTDGYFAAVMARA